MTDRRSRSVSIAVMLVEALPPLQTDRRVRHRLPAPATATPTRSPTTPAACLLPRPAIPGGISRVTAVLLLVGIATAFHVFYAGLIALSPQEAYYWQWSRHLDLSYYDHPPLAAWTIRAATALAGDSERAIRLAAVFWSDVFALFLFLAGRRLFGERSAAVALATALATPVFALGQTIITPDDPLLAGWAAALYFTVRALDGRGAWLLAAGAAIGVASLGKYTGFLLVPQVGAALLLDRRGRRLLRTGWPWLGLALALAIFSPVLVWNGRHDWISFRFQFALRSAQASAPQLRRFGSFLGLQSLAMTPILWAVLLASAAAAARRWREPAMRLCVLFSIPLLALLIAVSPFSWVKPNWSAPAYPSALLAAAALHGEMPRRRLALSAVGLALAASVYLHAAPLFPALPFPARDEAAAGWRDLAARVEAERSRIPGPSFVLGCYYKTASELAYYLPGRPETYSSEAMGETGLAYENWYDGGGLLGHEGIVVLDRRDYRWCLRRDEVCEPLEPLEPLVIRRANQVVTTFQLWRCRYPGTMLGLVP